MSYSVFFHIGKTKKGRERSDIFSGVLAVGPAEVGCRRVGYSNKLSMTLKF